MSEAEDLRAILGALLLKVVPDARSRGVDITLTPGELDAAIGWNLAVYRGLGIGVRPPLRVHMFRPKVTVAGEVDHGEGEPGGDGQPLRLLPPGG